MEAELFKNDRSHWLLDLGRPDLEVDGLVQVKGYDPEGQSPEVAAMMEKAAAYSADAVFFEAGRNGRPPVAQAFVFVSDGPANDPAFGELHKRLWSWGGVPLMYRKTPGLVQLFRCGHKPDFVSANGVIKCKPFKILRTAGAISSDPWWDETRLRNGTLWDDPEVCRLMLKGSKAAHKRLFDAVKQLNADLDEEGILRKRLRRRLLILSLLIAYLEERGVFPDDYFQQFQRGATRFFQVMANGKALVALLEDLEERFNGNVFALDVADRDSLKTSGQLGRFARLVEGRQESSGQLTLWQLYSFKDLPIELISQIYQIFVTDTDTSVYTPPFLVRLMLDETLTWDRLDRLYERNEIILDPACGSGVFLVESYKRLVLHWRSRNHWKKPGVSILKSLLKRVHGIDLEEGAVELAAFSLCLALCDALEPQTIRASIKLFPVLAGKTIHHSCFFKAKEEVLIKDAVGIVLGNPPFQSKLNTPGAERSYDHYATEHGPLPDKQLAYLFLHEAMELLAPDGLLTMLQQYNFLYNQQSLGFRREFIANWDLREVLDFISIRGLFQKGDADTKAIIIVAEARKPPEDRNILHATFRRSGRVEAEQGFDIDYYDLHWLPRHLVLANDAVWRTGLFGGGRVMEFSDRLKNLRTLECYATEQEWDFGEGFIEAKKGKRIPAEHLTGKRLLPSVALSNAGLDRTQISTVEATRFKSSYTASRFTPPMVLIREQMDLPHDLWNGTYLTYTQQIVGFCGPKKDVDKLRDLNSWLTKSQRLLQAHVALSSPRLFVQKATALQADDVFKIPYPQRGSFKISANEQILVDDIVDYYRDLVRLGDESAALTETAHDALDVFSEVFTSQINSTYEKNPLRALQSQAWPGVICQPFAFGDAGVDWSQAEELKDKLNGLLHDQQGSALHVIRIARIYDGNFIFLVKPDRLRYWLRSVALRDADETLSDLRLQGF